MVLAEIVTIRSNVYTYIKNGKKLFDIIFFRKDFAAWAIRGSAIN